MKDGWVQLIIMPDQRRRHILLAERTLTNLEVTLTIAILIFLWYPQELFGYAEVIR